MSASKLTALTALTTPLSTDIIYVVHDPSGTPVSEKCTLANLAANMPATTIKDTTPSLETASGQTNTGFLGVKGKTSGELKLTVADALAQTITITALAQTVGAAALSIPDFASVADTFVFTTLAQTLANKTITGPSVAVTGGLTSSGPTGTGIGYATGAGGTVSQGTDRTTTVVLNKLSGQITTQATSLAAGAEVTFTVTNSTVAAGDVVVCAVKSGGTTPGSTWAAVTAVGAGSFQITLTNLHASTADTAALVINFAVIKAVSA
jgi:hypothetical protein